MSLNRLKAAGLGLWVSAGCLFTTVACDAPFRTAHRFFDETAVFIEDFEHGHDRHDDGFEFDFDFFDFGFDFFYDD